jgi:O-antigen/teichoic acid export membrane protein
VNKNLKSIAEVMLSNVSTIVSGVLVGFWLPKIMSVESYGLYKTFTLYASYLGLFSLGIIDGVVLKYGEKNYDELDRKKFRSYFKWYCIVHVVFGTIICVMAAFVRDIDYRFIIIALAVYMIAGNLTGYFQQISQITMRFNELSTRKVLQSVLNVFIILILYAAFKCGRIVTYHSYLALWILVNVLLTVWYIYTYKDIVFSESLSLRATAGDIKCLISIGFPLLFANLCSSLILTLDRQFVNILFDTTTYAVYAFAYNMLTLVTVATSAVSTVLYPVLKRTNQDNLKTNYDVLVSTMMCFVFAAMIIYFPLSLFIKSFLPKYVGAIVIFRVIFPGLAISSTITVVMHNYYKAFGDNMTFFKKSIVVLIVSGVANYLAYAMFKTTISISAASITTMIFWYVYVEQYFVKRCGYRREKNLLYMILMSAIFYGVTFGLHEIEGGVIYCVLFGIITVLLYKDKISDVKEMIMNKE